MNILQRISRGAEFSQAACPDCASQACPSRDLDLPFRPEIHHRQLARGARLDCGPAQGCMVLWSVTAGTAAICTSFADGRRQIISLEDRGAVLCAGLSGASGDSWLEALSAVEICEIDLSPGGAEYRRDPEFLDMMFHLVHDRLTRAQAQLATLGRLDSRERVLLFLAETAAKAEGPVAQLPMSREDIADFLGLNAETVSRVLTQIRKSGLVKFLNRTEFVLPDLEAVQRRLPLPIPGADPHDQRSYA